MYGRKYKKRGTTRRRRNYRRRTSLALKAYKMAKSIKRDEEHKYLNLAQTVTNPADNTFASYNLIPIAQGDGPSDRDGNQITLKSMFFRVRLTPTGDYGVGINYRFIIVQDRQTNPNGTIPGISNILLNGNDFMSNYNYPAITTRYKVLYDKIHRCNPIGYSGGFASGGATWTDKNLNNDHYFFITLRRFMKNIRWYDGNASSLARYGIYLFAAVDNTRNSTCEFRLCLKYTDN